MCDYACVINFRIIIIITSAYRCCKDDVNIVQLGVVVYQRVTSEFQTLETKCAEPAAPILISFTAQRLHRSH